MFPPAGAAPREQFQGMSCQEHNLMEALEIMRTTSIPAISSFQSDGL